MTGNHVRVEGAVKRDARATTIRSELEVLEFCLEAPSDGSRLVFVDCKAFGAACDELEGYVSAGERIWVEGHLSYRSYTAQDGTRLSKLFVIVESAGEL